MAPRSSGRVSSRVDVPDIMWLVSRVEFEQLYRRQAGAVLAYARRRTVHAAADDVVAEVFLIAWRRFSEVPEDALPWLLGVARRVLANQRRGDSRVAALRDRIRNERSTGGRATESDVVSPSLRALWSLSDSDQELLMLIAWDGLTRTQVAAALGLSTGAVAVRLHRARRRLAIARAAATRKARVDGSSELEVTR